MRAMHVPVVAGASGFPLGWVVCMCGLLCVVFLWDAELFWQGCVLHALELDRVALCLPAMLAVTAVYPVIMLILVMLA